jgi:hypothetical protein
MIGERLGRDGVDRAHVKSVAAELQQAWASLLIRRGQSPATHPTPPLLGEAHEAIDRPASMPLPGPGSHGNAADPQQAAREFQQTTGLGAEALVNDGHNLPALVYHRVYLAARSHPAFAPAHRAQIVKAAQQCRERFARELQRASNTKPPDRRRLAPMAERLARATRSGA